MARDAAYLVTRFGIYGGNDNSERAERELVRLGTRAVPTLIATLSHREHGYRAAMLLSQIGAPAATRAIPALVRAARTSKNHFTQMWAARALGALGELDTLVEMAQHRRHHEAVVAGLKLARPASYPLFERLLARRERHLAKLVTDELAPGSATYKPAAKHFALVAEASRSSHAALRKDAAIAMSEVGSALKKRTIPFLTALLDDKDADVRRLAVMAFRNAGVAGRAAIPQITPLLRDPNAKVRTWAKLALAKLRAR